MGSQTWQHLAHSFWLLCLDDKAIELSWVQDPSWAVILVSNPTPETSFTTLSCSFHFEIVTVFALPGPIGLIQRYFLCEVLLLCMRRPSYRLCQIAEGLLAHLFFVLCAKMHSFWSAILEHLSKAYSIHIQPHAELAILGCSTVISGEPQVALRLRTAVAKKLIHSLAQRAAFSYSIRKIVPA